MKKKPAPVSPAQYLRIREASAPKLGKRAHGQLRYQVLADVAREAVHLRVTGNDGGGYFSSEAVPLPKIRHCLSGLDRRPLRSSEFRAAFTGRSTNNPGFLAAVLVAEGLLTRDLDDPLRLVDAGAWESWQRQQLNAEGEWPVVRIGDAETPEAPPAPPAEAPASNAKKGRDKRASKSAAAAHSAPDEDPPEASPLS